jgi:hypothetical protein
MSQPLRVFVNDHPLDVAPGSDALAAVRAFDPQAAETLTAGGGYLTDGRGIEIPFTSMLSGGSILRLVLSGRRHVAPDGPDS